MSSEIEKSTDFYFKKGFDFDRAIADSLLLTTSVIIVFTAGNAANSIFAAFSLICLGVTLIFGIIALFILKTMMQAGYNTMSKGQVMIEEKKKDLEIRRITNPDLMASEFSVAISSINLKPLGILRDRFNFFLEYAFIFFVDGIVLMTLGIIFNI